MKILKIFVKRFFQTIFWKRGNIHENLDRKGKGQIVLAKWKIKKGWGDVLTGYRCCLGALLYLSPWVGVITHVCSFTFLLSRHHFPGLILRFYPWVVNLSLHSFPRTLRSRVRGGDLANHGIYLFFFQKKGFSKQFFMEVWKYSCKPRCKGENSKLFDKTGKGSTRKKGVLTCY